MSDQTQDEPLDPKVEAIRRKMVRLLMVSGAIMMIGLMTVLIAIVYKLNATEATAPAATGQLSLPAGSQILSTSLSDDRIAITVKLSSGNRVIYIHGLDGRRISQLSIIEE